MTLYRLPQTAIVGVVTLVIGVVMLHLAQAQTWTENRCPPNNNQPYFYADPNNCYKFYQCNFGSPVAMFCPLGTVFNENKSTCVIQRSKDDLCTPNIPKRSRTAAKPVRVTTPASLEMKHCKQQYSPFPGDCTKFYECDYNRYFEMSCPAGTIFSRLDNVCIYANSPGDHCTDGSDPGYFTTTPAPAETAKPVLSCDGQLTFYPGDCTKYIQCLYGKPVVRMCGPGTVYNDMLFICVGIGSVWDNCP